MITSEFIHLPQGDRESIPIASITQIEVSRIKTGTYKRAAVAFFILGAITVWFMIGFLFIAWGVAAWTMHVYQYKLYVTSRGKSILILSHKRERHVKDIARTIHGVSFSQKILHTFA